METFTGVPGEMPGPPAGAGGQLVAEHESAHAFGVVVGDLDVETLALEFHPAAVVVAGAGGRERGDGEKCG